MVADLPARAQLLNHVQFMELMDARYNILHCGLPFQTSLMVF